MICRAICERAKLRIAVELDEDRLIPIINKPEGKGQVGYHWVRCEADNDRVLEQVVTPRCSSLLPRCSLESGPAPFPIPQRQFRILSSGCIHTIYIHIYILIFSGILPFLFRKGEHSRLREQREKAKREQDRAGGSTEGAAREHE